MKVLSAVCATSIEIKRKQIRFDEVSGLILEVGNLNLPQDRYDYFFDDDHLLFAGMGDVHIHAREDVSQKHIYKEDFLTARAAMINGGVTHAGDMPNNPIPPIDDNSYTAKFKLAMKAQGSLWLYAGIGPSTRPLSFPVPYKVYMGPSIGELYFKDLKTLDETLSHYQGQTVSFHCEDPELLEAAKNLPEHHLRRPAEAEVLATKDALMLIKKYNLKGKLCHYSTGEGLNLIRKFRAEGANVSIEVTPQHLYFDIDHLPQEDWQEFQMNPPIRGEADREAMFLALKNGEIQYLATDHAPHTHEEKQKGTSGLTGLDSYGPFVAWLLSQGLDGKLLAKVTAENPGIFFNQFIPSWKKIDSFYGTLGKGLGFLEKDYRASFTVLNLKKPLTLTQAHLKTKVQHNPFVGFEFPGSVARVFIGGSEV